MNKLFAGKVALVTGASFGIGSAAAVAFACQGAKVVIADWMEDPEQATINKIKALGGDCLFIKCDVSDRADVKQMMNTTISKYGRVDFALIMPVLKERRRTP
jgi:NAD(P)-dependent dehydrogenase (short-subunit alcohol dehydrogenase family)